MIRNCHLIIFVAGSLSNVVICSIHTVSDGETGLSVAYLRGWWYVDLAQLSCWGLCTLYSWYVCCGRGRVASCVCVLDWYIVSVDMTAWLVTVSCLLIPSRHYISHFGWSTWSLLVSFPKNACFMGQLGSGPHLMGRIGSGIWVSANLKKCPPRGSLRVRIQDPTSWPTGPM